MKAPRAAREERYSTVMQVLSDQTWQNYYDARPCNVRKNLPEHQASPLRFLPLSPLSSHAKASEIWSAKQTLPVCPLRISAPAGYINVEKLASQERLGPLSLYHLMALVPCCKSPSWLIHSPASEKARASARGQRRSAQHSPFAEKNMET